MCEQGYSHMEQCHVYVELVLRTARVHVRTAAGYSHIIWSEPSGNAKVGPKGCERPVIVRTGALWEQPLLACTRVEFKGYVQEQPPLVHV